MGVVAPGEKSDRDRVEQVSICVISMNECTCQSRCFTFRRTFIKHKALRYGVKGLDRSQELSRGQQDVTARHD